MTLFCISNLLDTPFFLIKTRMICRARLMADKLMIFLFFILHTYNEY